MVWKYFLIVAAFTIIFVPNAFADESYSFGFQPGTISFDTNLEGISCEDVKPEPVIGTTTSFNIDGMDDHFFIFLSKTNSNTHHYLQIEIPDDQGQEERDSYLINFLKDGEPKSRQLYQGYGQMSVYMITDSEEKEVITKKHEQFLTGESLKVSPHSLTYSSGEYDFHSILFQSDKTRFVDDEVCAISLHWNVSVDDSGNITTEEPSFTVGRVYLSDEPEVSPETSTTQNTGQDSVYLAIGTTGKDLGGVDGVGIVYVYYQDYSLVGTINNPEGKFHGQFGQFIKSSNNKLVVSAPFMYTGSEPLESGDLPASADNAGAAYLFDEISGDFVGILSDPYSKSSSEFGIDLDITANGIVVGDPNQDVDGTRFAGAIHVYDVTSGDLIKSILNPEPNEIDLFGNSVANLNDNIVVGIPGKDVGEHDLGGAVVILDIDSGAVINTIKNPEPVGHDEFGKSIETSNDLLLVAAPFMDIDGEERAGSVYLFDGNTGSLIHAIHNPEPDEQDNFGKSLLFFEDKFLVGAPGDGILDEGSVYVFDVDSGSLIETIKHPNRDVSTELFWGNEFGHSLEYHDGKIIIGDKNKTVDDKDGAGSVYVYDSGDYSLIKTIEPSNPARIDSFGFSVAFINNISGFVEPVTTDLNDNQDEFIVEYDQSDKEYPEPTDDKHKSSYQVGTIDWLEDSSDIGGYGTLKIVDPDMDKSDRVDIFKAFAWSDTDKEGIELDMIETGRNTGIFYIDVEFTTEESSIQELQVSDGDTVTAMYRDMTLPDNSPMIEIADTIEIIQNGTDSEQTYQQNNSLTISPNQDYFLHDQTLTVTGTGIPDDTLTVRLIAPDGHFAKIVDVQTDPNNGKYDFTVLVWSEATKEQPNGTYEVEIISSQNPALTESVYVNRISKESLFSGNVELPPIQQTKIGILPANVFCQNDLKLLIKTHDKSPACVAESTAKELIQRGGWEYVEWKKVTRWMESEYTKDSTAVLQITDSHIGNLDPDIVNNFEVHVWSDSDSKGISLTMTETGKTTGIFEGTVFFSTDSSSGHRLQVSEDDTIFAEYDSITATTSIR